MMYVCNTEGCPYKGIIMGYLNWDGIEPIDCPKCGEACELNPKEEQEWGVREG